MVGRADTKTSSRSSEGRGEPYLHQVHATLPRLLALYDANPASPAYGLGDRRRWAWKVSDFPNGTFQGAAHGLSRLLAADLLPPDLSPRAVLRRIDAMFEGTRAIVRPDGSLEEAFPHESSFCVTALVAYDLLSAVELLRTRIETATRNRYVEIVRPLVGFLSRNDETHAVIANHLATAAAALYKWGAVTGQAVPPRGRETLDRILAARSPEGWFPEYGGADPGYQTLAVHYLADLHRIRPDLGLLPPLSEALRFLAHFAHPDGSFGGIYGSRATRVPYPGGIEALSAEIPEAAALAVFLRGSIQRRATVTLDALDEPNLVPAFNSYCMAATVAAHPVAPGPELPCRRKGAFRAHFPGAGLLVDKGPRHYTVVSVHKGGVVYHFEEGRKERIDAGVLLRSRAGQLASTQSHSRGNRVRIEDRTVEVRAPFVFVPSELPTPFQFALLRLGSLTFLRVRRLREATKRTIVRRWITRRRLAGFDNRRVIRLGPGLAIDDWWDDQGRGYQRVPESGSFSAIHMASQGYWQRQDDEA